jgi:hypothetical protein
VNSRHRRRVHRQQGQHRQGPGRGAGPPPGREPRRGRYSPHGCRRAGRRGGRACPGLPGRTVSRDRS